MNLIFLTGAIVALAVPTSAESAADAGQLRAALRAAHAVERAKFSDKFAEPPKVALAGEAFRFELAPHDGDTGGVKSNSGMWIYKEGELLLSLSDEQWPSSLDIATMTFDDTKLFYIASRMKPLSSYVGESAYGARRRIIVEDWERDAIAIVSRPLGEPSPWFSSNSGVGLASAPQHYWVRLKISGEAARKLTATARFIVEGRFSPLRNGQSVACKTRLTEAKVDAPREIVQQGCWVGARIERVQIVNSATGEVLKAWGAAAP